MLLLVVLLHHIVPVALVVADLALEFDNPRVDSLVRGDRRFASEQLLKEGERMSEWKPYCGESFHSLHRNGS